MKWIWLQIALALTACGMWFVVGYQMGMSNAPQQKAAIWEIAGAGDQGFRKVNR